MTTPLSNKPKITRKDISTGYVMRYFVQNISTNRITEVDSTQYDIFIRDPHYKTVSFKWIISGYADTILTNDGNLLNGARDQNLITVNWYDRQMSGLIRMLPNMLEFFAGEY